jgi:hypothetical protein
MTFNQRRKIKEIDKQTIVVIILSVLILISLKIDRASSRRPECEHACNTQTYEKSLRELFGIC